MRYIMKGYEQIYSIPGRWSEKEMRVYVKIFPYLQKKISEKYIRKSDKPKLFHWAKIGYLEINDRFPFGYGILVTNKMEELSFDLELVVGFNGFNAKEIGLKDRAEVLAKLSPDGKMSEVRIIK